MAKKDYYIVEKNVNKILRAEPSNFLDPSTLLEVRKKLKGVKYNIYSPYIDADRKIIYTNKLPNVRLIEIGSYDELTHREIMGSLFATNINYEMFGDIIINDNHYYIIVLDDVYDYLLKDLTMIGSHHVKLKEVDIDILTSYEKSYEIKEIIVSSLRIDTIISRLINSSRDSVKTKFIDGDVVLNYEVTHKVNTTLNIGDTFSVKRYGKYKFDSIKGNSKSGNYIIVIKKYT